MGQIAHNKKVEIGLNVTVITTTMNGINFPIKRQNFQMGLKQTFMLFT